SRHGGHWEQSWEGRARALIHESGNLAAAYPPTLSRQKEWIMRSSMVPAFVLLSAATAAGQTPEEVKRVEPVVVTATKVETPTRELGASITVVNGDDFQTYHYATVDEALRNVPGLEITRSGSLGKLSTVFIRGANSNQVQVMVD